MTSRDNTLFFIASRPFAFAMCCLGVLLLTSCNKSSAPPANSSGPTKIRVGYIGLTCEAPIFTAVEKGFFK